MFSSITKSLASIAPSGPRALLASYIAAALSEHFVVDRDAVESSLLSEPRLVLTNTRLRRRRYRSPDAPGAIVTVGGEVQEVNFSWRWSFGSSGSSSDTGVVQDATLSINGLRARIGIQSWSEADEATRLECLHVSDCSTSSGDELPSASGTDGYLQNCIQQVVDHLTLKIKDFEFVLDLKHGPSVVIGGEDVHLETLSAGKGLGTDGSAALSQKLSIGSFHVGIEEKSREDGEGNTPATRHPLIEPFGYSASVMRLSGKRFQGGLLSGLEIVGLPNDGHDDGCPSGVVFHAGREQMQALFALGKILAPSNDGEAEPSRSDSGGNVGAAEDSATSESDVAAVSCVSNSEEATPKGSVSTVFILPLPSLTLALPGTRISLPSATATYRTDGRLFRVQGHEGIKAGGHPFIELEEGGQWTADLVKRSFVLNGQSDLSVGKAMATVAIRKDSVKTLLSAIESAAPSEDVSVLAEAWEISPRRDAKVLAASEQAAQTRPEPWSFSAHGTVILRLEDGDEWVEASAMRPSLAVSDAPTGGYTPKKIECEGIKIRTCSQGASVSVPPIALSKDGGTLHVTGTVEASIESLDEASKLGEFLSRFTALSQGMLPQSEPSEERVSPSLPFKVDLQATKFTLKDCGGVVNTGQMRVCGNEFCCANIGYTDLSGSMVLAKEIETVLGPHSSVEVSLAQVEKCSVPGLFDLTSPLKNARACFRDGELFLEAQSVCLTLSNQIGTKAEGAGLSSSEMSIPFPVNLKLLDVLKLERLSEINSESAIGTVCLRGIDFGLSPSGGKAKVVSRSRIDIRVERSQTEWLEGHIGPTSVRASRADPSSIQDFLCTGATIGASSFGHFSAQVPSISLHSEESEETGGVLTVSDTISVSLESTAMVAKLQNFLSQTVGLFTEKSEVGGSDTSKPLPFPVRLPGLNLVLSEPDAQVLAEDIDITEYAVRCGSMSCQGADGASASLKEIIAIVEETKVVIESVESLFIPGVARLSRPVHGTSLTYTDGTLKVEADSLNAVLLTREVVDSVGVQESPGAALELPFPIHFCLNTICFKQSEEQDAMIQFGHFYVGLSSSGHLLTFDAYSEISIRVSQSDAEWVEMKIDSPSVVIASGGSAGAYIPHAVQCASVMIGPCSFGKMSVCTSSFRLRAGTDCMSFDSPLAVEVESLAVIENLQSFVSQFADSGPERSKPLPFSVRLPEVKILLQEPDARITMQGIAIEGWEVNCSSIHFTEASGISASMLGVKGSLESDAFIEIESLFTLEVPSVLVLSKPVYGARILYTGGTLSISLDSLHAVISGKEKTNKEVTESPPSPLIPIPIHVFMKEICLKPPNAPGQCTVYLRDVNLEAKSADATTWLTIHKDAKLRVEQSSTEWIETSFGTFSCSLTDGNGKFIPGHLDFAGGAVGPCSYGHIFVQLPAVQGGKELTFCNNVEVAAESSEVVQSVISLLSRAMNILPKSEPSSEFPFPIRIPGIRLSVSKPKVHLIVDNILAAGVGVSCESVHVTEGTGLCSSLSGIKATVLGELPPRVDIGLIEALFIPGVANLFKPVANVTLSYGNNGELVAKIPSPMHVRQLESGDTNAKNEKSPNTPPGDFFLPFPICLEIFQLNLKEAVKDSSNSLRLCEIVVNVKSSNAAASLPTAGAILFVSAKVGDVESELFHVHNMKGSALVDLNRLDVIQKLQVALESARITAGFSSVDWYALLGDDDGQPPKVVETPFATVAAVKLEVSYKGKIAASETSIDVPPFVGDAFTTSEDLMQHYSKAVISRAPGFIANAEIMGSNVVDSTFSNAGRIAMTQSLAGSVAGSVVGIAAVDGVKGAIASGKKARGGTIDEGYHFGDVTRGTIRAVRESAKSGATKRRGDSAHYVPGDFTAGASAALSEYTSSNKSRLGAAGGSGVGSVVGFALAGPIGFVAGSYVGSKAGGSAAGGGDAHGEAMSTNGMQQTMGLSQPQSNRTACSSTGNRHVQTSDLLGIGTPQVSQPHNMQSHGRHQAPGVTGSHAPESHHVSAEEDLLGLGPTQAVHSYGGQSEPAVQRSRAATSQQLHAQGQNHVQPQQHYAQQSYAARSQQLQAQAHSHVSPQQQQQQQHPIPHNQGGTGSVGAHLSYGHPNHQGGYHGAQNHVQPQQHYSQQSYAARSQQLQDQAQSRVSPQQQQQQQHPIQPNQGGEGYHFGDITRSIVAKGKKKSGRDENSSYQFGDFTRGWLGK